jgi:biotin synthase
VISSSRWTQLADRVLEGNPITPADGLEILYAPDVELTGLIDAAYRIRHTYFSNRVKLNYLINAKSGLCPEDCAYCSQSKVATSDIPRYGMLEADEIVARASAGISLKASTCCIVASGRRPSRRDLQAVAEATTKIKEHHPDVRVCACLGLLRPEEAEVLARAGVDRYNHNINTSNGFYPEICSTHGFEDRVSTLRAVKSQGISPCSGVIIGMGEQPSDIVEMAISLRSLDVDSVPINFLIPIPGTRLSERGDLGISPVYALKVLCLFRFALPSKEIRISAGREVHLRSLQPLSLYPANALFVSDYLTQPGQPGEQDLAMIADLGFEVD